MYPPRKVLIIHPEGNIFNNPTLKCIVDLLKEKGVLIGIRYTKTPTYMPASDAIMFFPCSKVHKIIRTILFEILSLKSLIYLYVRLIYFNASREYDLVIGIDREGIIEAAALSRFIRIPCLFFSFEIMFEAETGKRFKSIERDSVRQIKYWFIQDDIRSKCLINENSLSAGNCFTFPVASAGLGIFCS